MLLVQTSSEWLRCHLCECLFNEISLSKISTLFQMSHATDVPKKRTHSGWMKCHSSKCLLDEMLWHESVKCEKREWTVLMTAHLPAADINLFVSLYLSISLLLSICLQLYLSPASASLFLNPVYLSYSTFLFRFCMHDHSYYLRLLFWQFSKDVKHSCR